jgi:serpin B
MKSQACALISVTLVAACSGTETDTPAAPEGVELVRSDARHLTTADISKTDLEAIEKAQRMFALDLYREVAANADAAENLLVSPYSVATSLGMTHAGARGNTRDEISAVLHLGDRVDALHPAMNAVANSLRQESNDSGLELFDSLWLSNTVDPREPFLDILSKYYDTGVFLVDFEKGPDLARKRINAWVSEVTRGRIEDLLPQGSLQEDTALALSNAVFLSAKWQDQFPREGTTDLLFTLDTGHQIMVPMMLREWNYAFVFHTDWRAVELPYLNSHVSMVFVLPNEGELAEFDAAFDEARLSEIVAGLDDVKASSLPVLSLRLPRFSFDSSVDLEPRLISLGMKDAFSPTSADFTGMAQAPAPLVIETALQKSHIAVDELGTVATAATANFADVGAMAPTLFFDRPFVFFIYDHRTGTVLFVGRVSDPGGEPVPGEPVTTPSAPERICALLSDCTDRTTTVTACRTSFDADDPSLLKQCADCLQLRADWCRGENQCADGGVWVCDRSACAEQCPEHDF